MGLFLGFDAVPSPGGLNRADYGLPACMYMDMLHGDFLLALAAMAI